MFVLCIFEMYKKTHFLSILILLICFIINEKKTIANNQETNKQQQQKYLNNNNNDDQTTYGKCEPLNTDRFTICKDIAYNQTRYPNFMKQKSQEEAANDAINYLPLIRINCSPVLKLFICSLYAPPCIQNYTQQLKPCREMCEQARSGCEIYMKRFQFEWSEYLECSHFPYYNSSEPCIMDDQYKSSIGQQQQPLQPQIPSLFPPQTFNQFNGDSPWPLYNTLNMNNQFYFFRRERFNCSDKLKITDSNRKNYYLSVNDELISECGMPCDRTLFDKSDISFARMWVLLWSIVCFSSTLFTILTFMTDTSRFRYPERPIIFISACYLVVSLSYLIGSSLLTSNQIVCQTLRTQAEQVSSQSGFFTEFLVQGSEYYPCTVLFMMSYFAGMASSIWWVVLTLTWFLAAGLKWGHEAIESISSYFHLAAWSIPAIKMIALLIMKKVDGDILSGICYTGITDMSILRRFILAPMFIYLGLGTIFLLAGFVSLFRIRIVMKHEGTKTDKLEKFMVRIGIFSILYMVPAIIVICCYFYEQSSYPKWIDSWLKRNAHDFGIDRYSATFLSYVDADNDKSSLVFVLYMIKYSMLLIVGITSSFWIWSKKTIVSWKRSLDRIFGCFNCLNTSFKHEAAV